MFGIHLNAGALILALSLGAGALTAAHADGGAARVPLLPPYQQECGACHLAYPPGLLPAASWQRLMGGLKQHFGSDASLDAATQAQISAWLAAHAGTFKRVSAAPPQDRITRSAWFLREHGGREIPPSVWQRPAVGSAANCAACHTQAAQGSFSERDLQIPR